MDGRWRKGIRDKKRLRGDRGGRLLVFHIAKELGMDPDWIEENKTWDWIMDWQSYFLIQAEETEKATAKAKAKAR